MDVSGWIRTEFHKLSTPGPDMASHGLDTTLSLLSLLGVGALDAYGVPWT